MYMCMHICMHIYIYIYIYIYIHIHTYIVIVMYLGVGKLSHKIIRRGHLPLPSKCKEVMGTLHLQFLQCCMTCT